jgi:hypothetical protein
VLSKQSEADLLVEDFNIPTITRIYAFIVKKFFAAKSIDTQRNFGKARISTLNEQKNPLTTIGRI